MDEFGHLYKITDLDDHKAREDAARLDGYLRARVEADAKKRKKIRKAKKKTRKHGRQ
jgi:hypothetical protein